MMLTAYDPFAATSAAFRALDQLAGRSGSMTARPLSGMPMDAYRVGDNFVAHFDLPGVDPGSIDLSVEGTTLTVSAERSVPQLENAEWVARRAARTAATPGSWSWAAAWTPTGSRPATTTACSP